MPETKLHSDLFQTPTTLPGGLTIGTGNVAITSGNVTIASGNVGIGTASPNAAAKLQIDSTTQGLLFPRMTTAQRDAISSPPAGLTIYNTDTNSLNTFT